MNLGIGSEGNGHDSNIVSCCQSEDRKHKPIWTISFLIHENPRRSIRNCKYKSFIYIYPQEYHCLDFQTDFSL